MKCFSQDGRWNQFAHEAVLKAETSKKIKEMLKSLVQESGLNVREAELILYQEVSQCSLEEIL